MPNYDSEQAAKELGISVRAVRKAATALGMQRIGRDWVFTSRDLERLRHRKTKPGRKPNDSKRREARRNEASGGE